MRVVIILDTVRYDEARIILWPEIAGTLYRATSLADHTLSFYSQIKGSLEGYPGKVSLITTGWGEKAGVSVWRNDYRWMFPLKDSFDICLKEVKRMGREDSGGLVLIHDFWIHNYFDDIGGIRLVRGWNRREVYGAYLSRIRRMIPVLQTFIREVSIEDGVEIFLTADHGEAFWEEDGRHHHGKPCRDENGVPSRWVTDIFVLDIGGKDRICSEPMPGICERLYRGDPVIEREDPSDESSGLASCEE